MLPRHPGLTRVELSEAPSYVRPKGTRTQLQSTSHIRTSFDRLCQIEGLREGAEEVSVMTEALVGLVPEVKSLHVVLNKVNHS